MQRKISFGAHTAHLLREHCKKTRLLWTSLETKQLLGPFVKAITPRFGFPVFRARNWSLRPSGAAVRSSGTGYQFVLHNLTMSSAPWATDRAVSSVRNSGESGSAKANCSPTFGRAELPPFPESHPQQTSSEATTIEKHRRIFMGSSELTVIIQRAVRILKRANSPPKLFHISRLRPSAPLGQHPNYPPPPLGRYRSLLKCSRLYIRACKFIMQLV